MVFLKLVAVVVRAAYGMLERSKSTSSSCTGSCLDAVCELLVTGGTARSGTTIGVVPLVGTCCPDAVCELLVTGARLGQARP